MSNSINLQLQTNEPISLDPTKKYFIYFVPTNIEGTASVTLVERNTGMTFTSSVNGYIKIKGKKIATVAATSISNGSLYLVDKDSVDVASLVGGNIVTLLANFFTNIYNQIITASYYYNFLNVRISKFYVTNQYQNNFTTTNTVIDNVANNTNGGNQLAIYFSVDGATSGETDTLTIGDYNNNIWQSLNVTNVTNQKIQLPNGFKIAIYASGVTSPTGVLTWVIGDA